MSVLWSWVRLIVYLKLDFLNAGLPSGPGLRVPRLGDPLDLAELFHAKASPPTRAVAYSQQPSVAASSKLVEQRVESARLSAQHMRTQQSRKAIIDRRHWLFARRRYPEQFIDLACLKLFRRLWSHPSSA